jgi:hypothetical protein
MPPAVPDEWIPRLRAYIQAQHGEDREGLSAYDFSARQSVLIHFPDGSFAVFRYAFVVWNETGDECAVFTEHCGYHVFRATRTEVEVVVAVANRGGG